MAGGLLGIPWNDSGGNVALTVIGGIPGRLIGVVTGIPGIDGIDGAAKVGGTGGVTIGGDEKYIFREGAGGWGRDIGVVMPTLGGAPSDPPITGGAMTGTVGAPPIIKGLGCGMAEGWKFIGCIGISVETCIGGGMGVWRGGAIDVGFGMGVSTGTWTGAYDVVAIGA